MMAAMPPLVFIFTCCILGGLLIFAQFGNIRFIKNSYVSFMPCLRNAISKFPQDSPEHVCPLALRKISLYTWRCSLHLGGCDIYKEARSLLLSLWETTKTSAYVLAQKQDTENKLNSKRSTRFGGLEELATYWTTSLFLLYSQAITWCIQQQN